MNHEYEDREQLPTAKAIFRRAGEVAVLHGRIDDTDNENETLRQFTLNKFPVAIKQQWPQLREVTYTPSYMVEGEPSGDMVWITLVDDGVRSLFMLSRDELDTYDFEVDHSAAEGYDAPYVSDEQHAATDAAINALFNDGFINSQAEEAKAEQIDFLLTQDMTPSPTDILMLDEIVTSLAAQYPRN